MYLAMFTLSDEHVRKVLADPPLIWKVVEQDDGEAYERARHGKPVGFLARLFGSRKETKPPHQEFMLADGEVENADLDKAWHGIHYLLTQTAWEGEAPLNFLLCGGATVGDIEVGYGPARAFSAAEVKAISGALRPIDVSFLRARFNPAEMMSLDIYPQIWDRDPADDDTFGYCAEYFDSLKSFVDKASERDLGLIIYL